MLKSNAAAIVAMAASLGWGAARASAALIDTFDTAAPEQQVHLFYAPNSVGSNLLVPGTLGGARALTITATNATGSQYVAGGVHSSAGELAYEQASGATGWMIVSYQRLGGSLDLRGDRALSQNYRLVIGDISMTASLLDTAGHQRSATVFVADGTTGDVQIDFDSMTGASSLDLANIARISFNFAPAGTATGFAMTSMSTVAVPEPASLAAVAALVTLGLRRRAWNCS